MTSEKDLIDSALTELAGIVSEGQGLTGGYRVQAREVLQRLWNAALWEPRDGTVAGEPATAPRSASEHAVGVEVPRRLLRVTESHESPGVATEDEAVGALRGWWEQTAHDEVAQLVAKMVEYGGLSRATDLTEIGRHLTEVGVPEGPLTGGGAVQEGWLQELGIYFYLVGKFARWSAAIQEGRPVSDDTLLDIGIYVRMAQRVRAVGGWPL